ncbi:MAG: hypothetical protein M1825_006026 [Sarcosagium campestre]|nr:MAG: hypothetical protein M1825_006026 [Sarcosagium campestre]
MVLEATILIVDNSESSRNGDYPQSRWDAQKDAVSLIFSAKTGSNPESSVGLMSMGGRGPTVLVTLTTDLGKILDGLHRTKIEGGPHLTTSIQVAQLALRHRQNKIQRKRIIVFCCSAIKEERSTLVSLAKKLKKDSVSVDFVAFGELEGENTSKLEAFNETVKSGDGSHLAIIPPGPHLLSDALVASPILSGDGVPGGAAAGGGGVDDGENGGVGGFEFGVDPSMDPELALALRMSFEEEKARVEKEKREKEEKEGKSNLEGIPEEGESSERKEGEGAGEGSAGPKDGKDDPDKMDTA